MSPCIERAGTSYGHCVMGSRWPSGATDVLLVDGVQQGAFEVGPELTAAMVWAPAELAGEGAVDAGGLEGRIAEVEHAVTQARERRGGAWSRHGSRGDSALRCAGGHPQHPGALAGRRRPWVTPGSARCRTSRPRPRYRPAAVPPTRGVRGPARARMAGARTRPPGVDHNQAGVRALHFVAPNCPTRSTNPASCRRSRAPRIWTLVPPTCARSRPEACQSLCSTRNRCTAAS